MENNVLESHQILIQLVREMREVLQKEKKALVEFDSGLLWEAQSEKQNYLSRVIEAKTKRETLLSLMSLNGSLNESDTFQQEWVKEWEALRSDCLVNQKLLKHSLKMMTLLSENFKRCLGIVPLYSPKGTSVDTQPMGSKIQRKL